MDDWQLLQEYVQHKSETAFTLLTERYVNLVYSAALRQTSNHSLAEEVVQAVFVLLARKAESLNAKVILAGWLFRTTRHVAHTAMRSEFRRRQREAAAMQLPSDSSEPEIWGEMAPLLDEALSHLTERDRTALLLRFFQEKTLGQIGQTMSTSEEAAKKRVARALEKLRAYLGARGVATTTVLLSGILATQGARPAPASLAAAASSTALGKRGAAAASALLLVEEVLRGIAQAKAKVAVGLFGALLLTALVGVTTWQRISLGKRPTPLAAATPLQPVAVAQSTSLLATNAPRSIAPFLALRLVSAENGQPQAGIPVEVSYTGPTEMAMRFTTDNSGLCRVPLAGKTFRVLWVTVNAEGYIPKMIKWFHYELGPDLEEYVSRLQRGRTVSGVVRDVFGQPVGRAGLYLIPQIDLNLPERETTAAIVAESSLEGAWICNQVPEGTDGLQIGANHPDFVPYSNAISLKGSDPAKLVIVLEAGVNVAGIVRDQAGQPVPGASVVDDPSYAQQQGLEATTDLVGQFYFPHVRLGKVRLKASKPGSRAAATDLDLTTNLAGIELTLPENMNALPGVPLPALREKTVILSLNVQDDQNGQPIDHFRVLLGEHVFRDQGNPLFTSQVSSQESYQNFLGEGRHGLARWDWNAPSGDLLDAFSLEVRADGYIPARSALTAVKEGEHAFEFRLTKSGGLSALVWTPQGQPATNAVVILAGTNFNPVIEPGPGQPLGLRISDGPDKTRTTTDSSGRFSIAPVAGMDQLIVLHDSGCLALGKQDLASGKITLQQWGTVEGVLHATAPFGHPRLIGLQPTFETGSAIPVPFTSTTRTDDQGHFTLPRVPPGSHKIFRVVKARVALGGPFGASHHSRLEVIPGETTKAIIGGGGRLVTGTIRTLPDQVVQDWTTDFHMLVARPSNANSSPDLAVIPVNHRFNAIEGHYFLQVSNDGSFIVDDVPAGTYELRINLTERRSLGIEGQPELFTSRPIGSITAEVVVPNLPEGSEEHPFDLGVITVPITNRVTTPK